MHKFEIELSDLQKKVIACFMLSVLNKQMESMLSVNRDTLKICIKVLYELTRTRGKTDLALLATFIGFSIDITRTNVYYKGMLLMSLPR